MNDISGSMIALCVNPSEKHGGGWVMVWRSFEVCGLETKCDLFDKWPQNDLESRERWPAVSSVTATSLTQPEPHRSCLGCSSTSAFKPRQILKLESSAGWLERAARWKTHFKVDQSFQSWDQNQSSCFEEPKIYRLLTVGCTDVDFLGPNRGFLHLQEAYCPENGLEVIVMQNL